MMESPADVISEILQESGIADKSNSGDEDEFFDAVDETENAPPTTNDDDVTTAVENDERDRKLESLNTIEDEKSKQSFDEDAKFFEALEKDDANVNAENSEGGFDNEGEIDNEESGAEDRDNDEAHGDDVHGDRDDRDDDDAKDDEHSHLQKEDGAKDKKKSHEFPTLEEDEELLKEIEINMTDEEKEQRKEEAQVLKSKGNEVFKNSDFSEAIDAYTQALHMCPLCYKKERSIMYSNRAACHVRMENNEEAVSDCSKAIELHSTYIKALLRRAQTYEKMEKLDEAFGDYEKVLQVDPSSLEARQACMRLPEEIKERNEKMKAEMMDKLKDLGNMILRPFGLSTNNFQMQQDSNTGSYSVNFVQNQQGNGR